MKTWNLILIGTCAAAALAGGAAAGMQAPPPQAPAPQAPQCFRADMIRNFAARDDEHLYLRVGMKSDVYVLDMRGACSGLQQADSVSIGSRACLGSPADVIMVARGGGRLARASQLCHAQVVAKLTKEEAATALPAGARP
jgi:hypothetical protein